MKEVSLKDPLWKFSVVSSENIRFQKLLVLKRKNSFNIKNAQKLVFHAHMNSQTS